MEARNRPLIDWFTLIRNRQIVLPRFQRFEAWTHRNVAGLIDTVLQELPAGVLLVLEIGDKEPFISRTMAGAPEQGDRIAEHLLDGQQRLTALWRSLTDNYSDRTYFVKVTSEENDESPDPPRTISLGRWRKKDKLYPLWTANPADVWSRGYIPLSLLCPAPNAEAVSKEWVRKAYNGDDADALMYLVSLVTDLRARFANFNLPFLSLPNTTSNDVALDVFIKMNTSAEPLSTYDIVVTQVEAATGCSLHELVDELRKEAPTLELFAKPAKVILSAGALIQNLAPNNSVMLKKEFAEGLIDNWDKLVVGAQRAARFLDEEHVFDSARLPSDPAVPMLVALWAHAPDGLDAEGEARHILRKFMWRAFLTERYEVSTNSRTFADYRLLLPMLTGRDERLPLIFDDKVYPLPAVEDLQLADWPKKRDRLGRAVLLLSLRGGGLDLADGSRATRENLRSREYHHIFPVALFQDKDSSRVSKALNCALVTWKTNRNIAAQSPIQYLRERINASSLGEDEIRRRLASHALDYDVLEKGDYDAFLTARAEKISLDVQKLGN